MGMNDDARARESVSRALEELARVAGGATVEVLLVEPATWPDASLGWPEEGRSYAQMLTEGHRVVAKIGGKKYECRLAGAMARCRQL